MQHKKGEVVLPPSTHRFRRKQPGVQRQALTKGTIKGQMPTASGIAGIPMAGDFYRPFTQRAGLWASKSLGALIYTLVFAVVFFVPCFLLVDRYPRRGIIRTLQVLAVACLLLIPALIVWLVMSETWQREIVYGSLFGVLVLAGAAIGFLRAAEHGIEVAALRPLGDPVVHWSQVVQEDPRWWIRSRAARELGQVTDGAPAARQALLESQTDESNRHVRAAIGASLRRLREEPASALP